MKIKDYYNSYKHSQKQFDNERSQCYGDYSYGDYSYGYHFYDKKYYSNYLDKYVINSNGDKFKLKYFKHPLWRITNLSNKDKYNLYEDFDKNGKFKYFDLYLDNIIDTDDRYKNFRMNQRNKEIDKLLGI